MARPLPFQTFLIAAPSVEYWKPSSDSCSAVCQGATPRLAERWRGSTSRARPSETYRIETTTTTDAIEFTFADLIDAMSEDAGLFAELSGGMSAEERKVAGPALNGLRDTVASAIAARKQELADKALDALATTGHLRARAPRDE